MNALFRLLFSPAPETYSAHALSIALNEEARNPFFYTEAHVPDTLDGRFDMLVVMHFLGLERLRAEAGSEAFQQALLECVFSTLDRSLREMGVGDLGVGRRIRRMADACKGRFARYRESWVEPEARAAALLANVYRGDVARARAGMDALNTALDAFSARLARSGFAGLKEGRIEG